MIKNLSTTLIFLSLNIFITSNADAQFFRKPADRPERHLMRVTFQLQNQIIPRVQEELTHFKKDVKYFQFLEDSTQLTIPAMQPIKAILLRWDKDKVFTLNEQEKTELKQIEYQVINLSSKDKDCFKKLITAIERMKTFQKYYTIARNIQREAELSVKEHPRTKKQLKQITGLINKQIISPLELALNNPLPWQHRNFLVWSINVSKIILYYDLIADLSNQIPPFNEKIAKLLSYDPTAELFDIPESSDPRPYGGDY